jgi:hypothetical protein
VIVKTGSFQLLIPVFFYWVGYGVLIKAYVQFMQSKLDYHQQHPAFRANFDYEEYVSLKGVEDPNEGYLMNELGMETSSHLTFDSHL